jgi:uncharacterized protein (TIRG00374 family)
MAAVRLFGRILPGRHRERIETFGSQAVEAFHSLRSPRILAVLTFFTFGLILCQVLTNYFVFRAFHLAAPFWAALVVLLAVQVGNLPPSAPGKIGIFEYAVILALAAFGIGRRDALSYGLILHVVAFLPKIILGFIYLSASHISIKTRDIHGLG